MKNLISNKLINSRLPLPFMAMLVCSAIYCFLVCLIKIDSDFGWHLKTGMIILQDGINRTEYFSYSTPEYEFINFEWLSQVIIALGYTHVGYFSLAAFYTFFSIGSFLLVIKPSFYKFATFPFMLAFVAVVPIIGVRVQTISLFLFSVLIYSFYKKNSKFAYLLPGIFMLWANLHGAFLFGLVCWMLFILCESINHRRLLIKSLILFALSIIATFVNPYGIDLWKETLMIVFNSSLRFTINEWLPVFFFTNVVFYIYVAFACVVVFFFRDRYTFTQKVLFFVMLLVGFSSIRHSPFWVLFSLPMIIQGLIFLHAIALKKRQGKRRFWIAYWCGFGGAVLICFIQLIFVFQLAYGQTESRYYPKKAVYFLQNNIPQKELFSTYEWGGYLIWKLPEKKVFIDGRMAGWKVDYGTGQKERVKALEDYLHLLNKKKSFSEIESEYAIDTVLLPRFPEQKEMPDWIPEFLSGSFIQRHTLISKEELEKMGWERIYEDEVSVIYQASN